ncbi:MAG: alpha/beta hydrolase [Gammaproteobacteria bacterium]|nr:alpha/beta hydrolase [Gammaproteobacteria bacterium]
MPLSSNGTAYQIAGPDNAPAIALLHGIGMNRQLWRDYEPVLAKRYRVFSYDLPGHGESAPSPAPLSLKRFANQFRDLMDELDIPRCTAIGFSMGGMINRRFVMDYPERADALVILNSPHERSPEAQQLVENRAARTLEGGPAATMRTSLERWFTSEFLSTQAETVDEVRQWVLGTDPTAFTQSRQVLAAGVRELVRPEPPIFVPTLVITCENDSGSTPEMAHDISSDIAGARTLVVPGLQHLGMLEQPTLFIEPMLKFLHEVVS